MAEFCCCPICRENILLEGQSLICTPCGHLFHRECITKWLRTSRERICPTCVVQLRERDFISVFPQGADNKVERAPEVAPPPAPEVAAPTAPIVLTVPVTRSKLDKTVVGGAVAVPNEESRLGVLTRAAQKAQREENDQLSDHFKISKFIMFSKEQVGLEKAIKKSLIRT